MSIWLRIFALLSGIVYLAACSPQHEAHSEHSQHTHPNAAETLSKPVDMSSLPAGLTLTDARIRAAFAGATTGAAYVTINNKTNDDVHLMSVSVNQDIAMSVEIHDMRMSGDMMQMFELEDGVVIPSQSQLQLRPGGKHIMFMGLATELSEGKAIELTFEFAEQPAQTILVPVVKL